MFRRICNPPAICIRICNPALLFLLFFCFLFRISFFSDYKSLYSMMPDFKSGITFTSSHHVQADLQSACNLYKDFQSATSVTSSLLSFIPYFFFLDYKSLYSMMPDFKSGITFTSSHHVQADLQSACIWHSKVFRRICNPPASGTLKCSGGFAIRLYLAS